MCYKTIGKGDIKSLDKEKYICGFSLEDILVILLPTA